MSNGENLWFLSLKKITGKQRNAQFNAAAFDGQRYIWAQILRPGKDKSFSNISSYFLSSYLITSIEIERLSRLKNKRGHLKINEILKC